MTRLRSTGRYLATVEFAVVVAILLTLGAIFGRDPLTREGLDLRVEGAGQIFYVYSYGDQTSGGNSVAAYDPGRPMHWTCTLNSGIAFPFCGFGLQLDTVETGRGVDVGDYDQVILKFRYSGPGKLIRVTLKDHDPRYKLLKSPMDKVNQANFPVSQGEQTIKLTLGDFAVADWWREQTQAQADLARPSFKNVVAVELITAPDPMLGKYAFDIEQVSFVRHIVSAQVWYAAIALCWVVLATFLVIIKRRQLKRLRSEAEQTLQKREKLHRTILETSTDCIILFTADGRIEFANGRAIESFAMGPAEEVEGKHWGEIWAGDGAALASDSISRAAAGETVRLRHQAKDLEATSWDVVLTPMRDEQGEVRGVLSISRDVTAELAHTNELQWASEHDPLTQLPNRRAFQTRLQAATIRAMETGLPMGLLLVDLDHFKHVNDTLGHGAGDQFLKVVGERLRNAVREEDFVARIGGDEFAIILEQVESEDSLSVVGAQTIDRINAPMRAGGRAVRASASIGGAVFPIHAESANDLLKRADMALYALKANGRGGTRLFDDFMLEEAERSANQLSRAREALDGNKLTPLYQPKIELDTGRVVGVEALLRWRHPRLGLQLPSTVEEAFKDYELASKIGEIMQRKVSADIRKWVEAGVAFGRVSINAAPAEFLRDDYAERLLAVLAENEVSPSLIEIEVTEHAFLGRGPEYVARALAVLKEQGASIALDDFGTGCSSLSHLRDFPVDVVKIDMSFVQRMAENAEIASIVTAVVRLAHSLAIDAVAEGVETPGQRDLLRAVGCRAAQGHLFSAAVPADEVVELFPRRQAAA